MRRILAGLACAGIIASAQAQVITGAMFMPSPVGVALSIGQWIINNGERTYYIEVMGEGANTEEARNNGFRVAVEQAVGAIIASESEVNNGRLTRDEIISYASAYVYRYEIVNQRPGSLGVKTTMKVWLKRSAVANRLLNESKQNGVIDGASAAVSLQTINQERQTSDQLISAVLRDYPRRAFDIEIGKTRLEYDNNRQPTLIIPYMMRLNQNYVESLWAAIKATENPGGCASQVTVKSAGFFGAGGTVDYADSSKYPLLAGRLVHTRPVLALTLYSESNQALYQDTFNIKFLTPDSVQYTRPAMFNVAYNGASFARNTCAYNRLLINGENWVGDNLIIVNPDPAILSRITRAELKPVIR